MKKKFLHKDNWKWFPIRLEWFTDQICFFTFHNVERSVDTKLLKLDTKHQSKDICLDKWGKVGRWNFWTHSHQFLIFLWSYKNWRNVKESYFFVNVLDFNLFYCCFTFSGDAVLFSNKASNCWILGRCSKLYTTAKARTIRMMSKIHHFRELVLLCFFFGWRSCSYPSPIIFLRSQSM